MPENSRPFVPIEEQFKVMADKAPVMIWVAGADKARYYFNTCWLNCTGRSLLQEMGNGWTESIHPDDLERLLTIYQSSFDTRLEYKTEYRLKNKSGQYCWVLEKGAPRYIDDNEFAGYIGSCMDVDGLLRSERMKTKLIRDESTNNQHSLTEELTSTNEELVSTNEELAKINEELQEAQGRLAILNDELEEKVRQRTYALEESEQEQQALNEELSATNEELASTNEELSATNEELLNSQRKLQHIIAELAESEHRVRSIVESAPFPIGVYEGREMRIILANKSIMDVWGKGYDVIGKTYHEILPELDNQQIYEQLDQVFTTGEPFHARNQRVDIVVDGKLQPYYFNYSFTPLYDTLGNIYAVMNTAAEVTDIVVAKQQVEQSEQNLHNMILQAPVAMCIIAGKEHIVEVANDMMLSLWAKPAAEFLNRPIFDVLPDVRQQGLEELMDNVYHTGETYHANEMPVAIMRNGDQQVMFQDFVYQPYRDNEGKVLGIIAIIIDVTDKVFARQRLEQSLESVQKLQRQKDDFIGIASHELKTPLTSLSALIQVLTAKLKDTADPFVTGALAKANIQIKKMTNLINGFLNISRLESGKIIIEKERFRLDQLLHEMAEEIQITTQLHTIYVNQSGPVVIFADKDKIGSVVTNLLSNAVKYSPRGKSISVDYQLIDGFIQVAIKDEGMGVKEDDLNKLFDRYYRVESSYTKHISGFGIGLYLSAEIVKQHGGRIWAESESGVGSTFYFTLPLQ